MKSWWYCFCFLFVSDTHFLLIVEISNIGVNIAPPYQNRIVPRYYSDTTNIVYIVKASSPPPSEWEWASSNRILTHLYTQGYAKILTHLGLATCDDLFWAAVFHSLDALVNKHVFFRFTVKGCVSLSHLFWTAKEVIKTAKQLGLRPTLNPQILWYSSRMKI